MSDIRNDEGMVSFDLDSTLCDTTPRRHLIETCSTLDCWEQYSLACIDDLDGPALPMAQYLSVLRLPFVVVSARDEVARPQTLAWLHGRGVFPWAVLLNDGSHDGYSHGEWKARRLLDAERVLGRKITVHFDDWSGVAVESEKIGIRTCLVHAPGATQEFLG